MQKGIKLRAYPNSEQREILSQWMGCYRVIWNAKCDQWRYETTYAKKYLPVRNYAAVDASYSQFKNRELTPYLFSVPSEILKDAANCWRDTMRNWMNPQHPQKAPARRKKSADSGSIFLEQRLFHFETDVDSKQLKLFIGTKTRDLGFLKVKYHHFFRTPKSIRIRKKAGVWWVSFSYEEPSLSKVPGDQKTLELFRKETRESLEDKVIGVDRGVAVAAQTDTASYDYSSREKNRLAFHLRSLRRYQKRMARQRRDSKGRGKLKRKVGRSHLKVVNLRNDFCHKTSHKLTTIPGRVICMEQLPVANMTRRPKAKKDPKTGKWEKNGAR